MDFGIVVWLMAVVGVVSSCGCGEARPQINGGFGWSKNLVVGSSYGHVAIAKRHNA